MSSFASGLAAVQAALIIAAFFSTWRSGAKTAADRNDARLSGSRSGRS
jgi:hypothetical protein